MKNPLVFSTLAIFASISWPLDLVLMPYLNKVFVDRVSQGGDIYYIVAPLSFLFVFKLVANLLNRTHDYLWITFLVDTQSRIRKFLFKYVHGHSYQYFIDHPSGKLSQRLNEVVRNFENLVGFFMELLIPLSIGMVFTIALTARISYIFALVFVVWFLFEILIAYSLGPKALEAARVHSNRSADLGGAIIDSILNAINVKIFSSPLRELGYIKKKDDAKCEAKKSSMFHSWRIRVVTNVIDSMFFIVFFFMLLYLYKIGRVTLGDFILIYGLYINFGRSMSWMGTRVAYTLESIGIVNNNLNILLEDYSMVNNTKRELEVTKGEIVFENVTVNYGNVKAIENFYLTIKPREKVGIVGASGAGKSSLLSVLMRFFDFEGDIRIDGQSIKMVTQESLRDNISYVTQESMLFSRSILENISYSRRDASKQDVDRSIELANATSFIKALPEGIDTLVGERGITLSGGQRQRVSIARALLKNSKILLMDEATSALDSEAEQAIQESMKNLMKGKTALIIAHRLSTISSLDRLIVMDDGKIVEEGTHKELLEKNGRYARLWKMQSDGFM